MVKTIYRLLPWAGTVAPNHCLQTENHWCGIKCLHNGTMSDFQMGIGNPAHSNALHALWLMVLIMDQINSRIAVFPVSVILPAPSCRLCVVSSWMNVPRTMCWKWQPALSPTTWMCLPSARAASWLWRGPSRPSATAWWWLRWPPAQVKTWLSSASRSVLQGGRLGKVLACRIIWGQFTWHWRLVLDKRVGFIFELSRFWIKLPLTTW